jgi:hypothetical protein
MTVQLITKTPGHSGGRIRVCLPMSAIRDGVAGIEGLRVPGDHWDGVAGEVIDRALPRYTRWPVDPAVSRIEPELLNRYLIDSYNWTLMLIPVSSDPRAFEAAALCQLAFMTCDRAGGEITREQLRNREASLLGFRSKSCWTTCSPPWGRPTANGGSRSTTAVCT